jgi:hypothetical protein
MRAPVEELTQAVTKSAEDAKQEVSTTEGKNEPKVWMRHKLPPSIAEPITNIPGGSPHMAIDSRNIEIRLDTLNETLQDLLPQVVSEVSKGTSATNNVSRVVDDLTFRG